MNHSTYTINCCVGGIFFAMVIFKGVYNIVYKYVITKNTKECYR